MHSLPFLLVLHLSLIHIYGHLRQKGKIAELALGYGGSVGALKAMGPLDMGLEESELQPLVDAWRTSNPVSYTHLGIGGGNFMLRQCQN